MPKKKKKETSVLVKICMPTINDMGTIRPKYDISKYKVKRTDYNLVNNTTIITIEGSEKIDTLLKNKDVQKIEN